MPLPEGRWVDLKNEDRLFFVHAKNCFTVSTTEDTFTEAWAVDEDEPVTEGKPKAEMKSPIDEPPTTGRTPWDFACEMGRILLNGPDGIPDPVWWVFLSLLSAAIAVAWFKYN